MAIIGNTLSALGLAALIGGMLFFGAIMAPLVFTKLPPDIASTAIGAAGFLLRRQALPAGALILIVLVTIWLWVWLIPHLNALRDAGNDAAFARGHQLSVWINGGELLTALWLLLRTAV